MNKGADWVIGMPLDNRAVHKVSRNETLMLLNDIQKLVGKSQPSTSEGLTAFVNKYKKKKVTT